MDHLNVKRLLWPSLFFWASFGYPASQKEHVP
jgi:hypothetical protein